MIAHQTQHRRHDGREGHLRLISAIRQRNRVEVSTVSFMDRRRKANDLWPGEVVSDDSASYGHLLTGEDELADPDEADGVVPHHVLQRPVHTKLHQTRLVILHWTSCEENRLKHCSQKSLLYLWMGESAPYGGIVPPSKWKSQSLMAVRSSGS